MADTPYRAMRKRHVAERNALVLGALAASHGNRTKAAKALGMDRGQLQRVVREQALTVPEYKP